MSDDIVEWLRWWESGAANRPGRYDEAADEIERLRAEMVQDRALIEKQADSRDWWQERCLTTEAQRDRLLSALSDTEMGEEEAAEIAAEVRAEIRDTR